MKLFFKYFFILINLCCTLSYSNYINAEYLEKTISVDNGDIKYYQIGTGDPVLMLHGMFANKEQWLDLVKYLIMINPNITKEFQFIIPDLAGYGGSTNYPIKVYKLDVDYSNKNSLNKVEIIHDFIEKLDIKSQINIAGNSMGGLIMTLYTMHYPKQVKSLAYIGSP